MRILHINTYDSYGGADSIMNHIRLGCEARGYSSPVLVDRVFDSSIASMRFEHDARRGFWARAWIAVRDRMLRAKNKSARGAGRFLGSWIGEPLRSARKALGHEDFDFPDSVPSIEKAWPEPDILHFHGLHGGYFDLRALRPLSRRYPVFVTLHDAWLFTGHCAYPVSCDRFHTGCGQCPDLKRFPKIVRDATRYNLRRKRSIYRASTLYLAAPSKWMMEQLETSAVADALPNRRVIYNGICMEKFIPTNREQARIDLDLTAYDFIALYAARHATTSPFKDYRTVRRAMRQAAEKLAPSNLLLLVLGENLPEERDGNLTVCFRLAAKERMRDYYAASDVYLHAAAAENFPTTVLEAMACGRPVVATATGGIPEQVRSVGERISPGWEVSGPDRATGVLVSLGDSSRMGDWTVRLAENPELKRKLGDNGRARVEREFHIDTMVDRYLQWYREILDERAKGRQ